MILLLHILSPILIGAAIGCFTNWLAIKMLFRPHRAKFMFGHKLPFTPGIIPKEKDRIAASIGAAVSTNLMNKEVLSKNLLSGEMSAKLSAAIDSFFLKQKSNSESLRGFLSHYVSADDIDGFRDNVSADLSAQISAKLSSSDLGGTISHIVVEHALSKVRGGIVGDFVADKLAKPAENLLTKNVNEMIASNAPSLVSSMVDDQTSSFLDKPMSSFFSGKDEQLSKIRNSILSAYSTVIENHLPHVLETIDISRIIEERINEMDIVETERIILEVMDKELKAIVWLGAFLGALMGAVNIFV